MDHPKIAHKIPEQHAGKTLNCGTVDNNHIKLCKLMFIGPCFILIVNKASDIKLVYLYSFHYLMLNMFRMLVHPSSGTCDLFVELFHVLYCSGSMCVHVTVWFGWGGVVSLCRLKLI